MRSIFGDCPDTKCIGLPVFRYGEPETDDSPGYEGGWTCCVCDCDIATPKGAITCAADVEPHERGVYKATGVSLSAMGTKVYVPVHVEGHGGEWGRTITYPTTEAVLMKAVDAASELAGKIWDIINSMENPSDDDIRVQDEEIASLAIDYASVCYELEVTDEANKEEK